jgi:hypothetical protein
MKKIYFLILLACFFTFNCSDNNKETDQEEVMSNELHKVVVIDKIDANNYSYLEVNEADETFWIAVPKMEIDKGEELYFSRAMEMKDFKSETIDRTFESILFVEDARKSSEHHSKIESPHSTLTSIPKEDINIEPVENGYTVGKLFKQAEELEGKTVKVKGKVVKYNHQIMSRNWIHLQDGTSEGTNYDLVVTSDERVNVGDVIIVEGTLVKDKDFGSGYLFKVLIEDAKVFKEY